MSESNASSSTGETPSGTQSTASTMKPAALWKRLFSIIYDLLILGALSLLYGAIVTLASTVIFGNTPENYEPNASGIVVQIGWLATIVVFYCFFWIRVGQTVAMKAWRLKLVNTSGGPLSLNTCLLRCALGFASIACFGLGYLWSIFDPEKLALHDRLTHTRVIQLSKEEA